MAEIYILTKAGMLHTGYRVNGVTQTAEQCNLDDASIDCFWQQDDETKAELAAGAKQCKRCFPDSETE